MGRTAGRDADGTRRIILDAATPMVARHGQEVSLARIAAAAGVSKGGLLYHFPTKEHLLRASAADLFARFREAVYAETERERGDAHGRLARGYIRATFAEVSNDSARDQIAVAAHLMGEPGIQEIASADGRRWREELMADGLGEQAVRVIVAASDGVGSAPLWGAILDPDDCAALKEQLLDMTRVGESGES
ncbi:TetR/AcrR family transcriptional regulator [Microbacterium sp.]|uniref:TetR/AcrR family transcriptional regulator n=1 Tax=Microbacterium sp. TaxID=51671 RepID=UPI003F9B6165